MSQDKHSIDWDQDQEEIIRFFLQDLQSQIHIPFAQKRIIQGVEEDPEIELRFAVQEVIQREEQIKCLIEISNSLLNKIDEQALKIEDIQHKLDSQNQQIQLQIEYVIELQRRVDEQRDQYNQLEEKFNYTENELCQKKIELVTANSSLQKLERIEQKYSEFEIKEQYDTITLSMYKVKVDQIQQINQSIAHNLELTKQQMIDQNIIIENQKDQIKLLDLQLTNERQQNKILSSQIVTLESQIINQSHDFEDLLENQAEQIQCQKIQGERIDRLQQRSNSLDQSLKGYSSQKDNNELFRTNEKKIQLLKHNTSNNKKNICNSCLKRFQDNFNQINSEIVQNSNNSKLNNNSGNDFSRNYGGLLSELILEDINLYHDKYSSSSKNQQTFLKQNYKNHIDKFNFRLKKKKQLIERISGNKNSMSVPTDDNQGLYSSQGLTKSASASHQEISLNEFNESNLAQNDEHTKSHSNKHYRQILDKFKSDLQYEHSIKNRLQKISEVYVSDFSSYADNLNQLQQNNNQSFESIVVVDSKPEIKNRQMKVILMLIYVLIKHPKCLQLLTTKLFKGIDLQSSTQIPKNLFKFNLPQQTAHQNNSQFQLQSFILKYIKYIIYYFIFQMFSATFRI
ncbi:hypothetical protein TTHERM_00836740 (macronuclear) [Tetrahymena thermophila SB210]|uniref:Uncharacterized protein n=1 Tax=Tetrahymena thermophila (strain SB210) TaxID=312017 RepID=I7M467_TETTS|nr:hypothetical protein TTHERM_00836740 [Tetrahymena thermophila SB210]EAS05002.2 hypothetical protein TTHERM_00836740 [Tetrahymena thermophila SB210]|eukprot:XP_001025247.2 hypothetical protein TTHERM_00836740 [Tetrahymena thermophila SB210]